MATSGMSCCCCNRPRERAKRTRTQSDESSQPPQTGGGLHRKAAATRNWCNCPEEHECEATSLAIPYRRRNSALRGDSTTTHLTNGLKALRRAGDSWSRAVAYALDF